MALSADAQLARVVTELTTDYPVLASATIYAGSMVGKSAGYARALTAGDQFLGHATAGVVDTSAVSGTESVQVWSGEYDMEVTLSAVAITDVGDPVYASDDATLTLTTGSVSPVGFVKAYVKANTAVVRFVAPVQMDRTVGAFNDSGSAGYGIPISSARQFASGVYGDDAGAALTVGYYAAQIGHMLVATAITGAANVSTFGLVGECHVGASLTIGGNVAGVFAYTELATTKTMTQNANCSFSGLLAGLDLPSGAILAADTCAAGVAIGGNFGGTHTAGKIAGVYFTNPGTGTYDYAFQFGSPVSDGSGLSEAITANTGKMTKGLKVRFGATDWWFVCQSATS